MIWGSFINWWRHSFSFRGSNTAFPFRQTDSSSGKTITPETSLQVSTAWACMRLRAQSVATLPLQLFERHEDERRTVNRQHPLYTVLHDQPNENMSAAEYWQSQVLSLDLWGNAYSEKMMRGTQVIGLDPLNPEYMVPRWNDQGDMEYEYRHPKKERTYRRDEIFHVKGMSVDGLIGMSPITYARHTLGLVLSADETAGKLFANGLRPSMEIRFSEWLTKEQRQQITEHLQEFQGSENAYKVWRSEGGGSIHQLSMNPHDAEMLANRSFGVEEVCRWFGIPPFMVGHTEKSTSWGTGLEQQNIGFLTYNLSPVLNSIEQAVKRQLLTPAERLTYFAEFNLEGLLRADSAGRAQFYSQMTQNGMMTRNEGRQKENLPPQDGGDVLTVQSNLVPIAQLGQQPEGQQVRNLLRTWLEKADEA